MSGSKFKVGKFYRSKGDCSDFIEVTEVLQDSGTSAELKVIWYNQMKDHYFRYCANNFMVSKNQYERWMHYKPIGDLK